MIKKIAITILSLLIFISASVAYACDFKIGQFGDSRKKIKIKNFIPTSFLDHLGGEKILIPFEEICRNDKSLFGTYALYLYINDKLSQIRLERPNMNDGKLMDLAMEKYGKFTLPAGLKKKDWRGSNQWENDTEIITSISSNLFEGSIEILEINSKKYENNLTKYSAKLGKWLDSQK